MRSDEPEIGPDELDAVNLFLTLSTQWRRAGLAGIRTGLDYGVIPATAAMLSIEVTAALLHDIRVMENEAAGVFAR